ncbi:hypothetical protein C8F04DRAFT_1259149 [Mycena alexandri]|uniref:Uncharacterized protein n=1 Tax=Mycena alexandri TaxID=1745969 RepID=A0AAD6SZV0_9AGAR|nr:hypothetical protein C8F04DRAFT_1185304 [Mycena alexandri]KAJ7035343.1 hypothetical protein C8F04DRAFT_1259149 [Mycena alexandri]
MPSFSQIAALATVAFAAFAAAAPVERDLPVALPAILTSLVAELSPVTALLSSIDATNATAQIVDPITDQIEAILEGAVSQVSALAGAPIATVLSTADGVLSVADTAQLLGPVLTIVFTATQDVLNAAGPAATVIQPLLDQATAALNPLLVALAPLVNGLLAATAPIVAPVVGELDNLGLGPVVGLVGSII